MKITTPKLINNIPKRILLSTSGLTYAVLFFILIATVGIHTNLSHTQLVGAYVNASIIAGLSLA
jgi:hypothetical protein